MRRATTGLGLAILLTLPGSTTGETPGSSRALCSAAAGALAPPNYYGIDLVPTKRVPGTGGAKGMGRLTFARSPFGVSISPRGTYVYDLTLEIDRLKPPEKGAFTAWVSTPALDKTKRLGVFDDEFKLSGQVDWNKFLVIVTLEPSVDENATTWHGPIIMRGLSRSGLMHTMAGHGPFASEPCSKYGY